MQFKSRRKTDDLGFFEMTEDEYRDYEDSGVGLCLHCGNERSCCEPDACRYNCEVCEEKQVYGVPELLLMGKIDLVEEEGEDE